MTQVPPEGEAFGGTLPTPPYPPILPGQLDSIARSEIIVGGLTIGFRRALEFVAGSTGTVITAVDDPTNEKVTITITSQANTVGDVKESFQTADHGSWLILQGGSFSGVTYPNLQTLLGGTTLPDMRGRSPIGSGTGTGLTARVLKLTYGTETHTQLLAQIAQHSHTLDNSHTHDMAQHSHDMGGHTHNMNAHTHSLSSHTHGLEDHTHGVDSGSAFFSSANNGVFDLSLVGVGGGTHYKNTTTQTMTPGFFGGANGPSNNTSGTPSAASTLGPSSTNTGLAGSGTGQAAINTTNTANAGNSGTTPTSGATAMPILHPVLAINFFIFAT